MWKLKIGKGNGEDPHLFSSNNFVGRQTWKFDHKAGSPEERAAVEEARRGFLDNRFRVKGCSDLLWRMQVSSFFPHEISYTNLRLFCCYNYQCLFYLV